MLSIDGDDRDVGIPQFGGRLIAIFGAAGLAVGLALQGTLSNVAAGVMLLLFRPFKVGDYIDGAGGAAGTVVDLSLFTTELATPDNVQVIVPNSLLWGTTLRNYSFHKTRRVDFLLGIGYRAHGCGVSWRNASRPMCCWRPAAQHTTGAASSRAWVTG